MEIDARLLVDLLLDRKQTERGMGQHYLHDERILASSIEACTEAGVELNSTSRVLEVGPGAGSLTLFLLATGAHITAIEIDSISIEHLNRVFPEQISTGQLEIIEADALKTNWPEVTHIVANIPYQISSPILERIHQESTKPGVIVLLLQEEFARRLGMEGGPQDRGSLGLNTWLEHDVTSVTKVPPHCFQPAPRVHSRLISLTPASRDRTDDELFDPRLFNMMIRQSFERRRQKLRTRLKRAPRRLNRLKGWHRQRWADALNTLDSDTEYLIASGLPEDLLDLRPESLTPGEWVDLTRAFISHQSG
jgi:ribosomal RNA small subunit methyltransferase A